MSATPKVSVITPAYKAARYIGQAIESVQAQTLTDWEMIIVDDASPDETAEVVKRYLDDPRIKLIRSERNRGECGARNLALEAAQGEWIAVLDADDWFAPERLEHLWRFAQEKGATVVADLQLQIDDAGKTYGVSFPSHLSPPMQPIYYSAREYLYHHIPMQPFAFHEHILLHRLKYPEGVVLGGDFIFQVQLVLHAFGVWILPEPTYLYRVYPTSMFSLYGHDIVKVNQMFDILASLDGIRNDAELVRCVEVARKRFLLPIRYRKFVQSIRSGQLRAAWHHFSIDVAAMLVKRMPGAVYRRLRAHEKVKNPREEF